MECVAAIILAVILLSLIHISLGPYSQGIEVNGVLYVSGQIPFVPETMELIS